MDCISGLDYRQYQKFSSFSKGRQEHYNNFKNMNQNQTMITDGIKNYKYSFTTQRRFAESCFIQIYKNSLNKSNDHFQLYINIILFNILFPPLCKINNKLFK